jgi:hypothetical protein
VVDFFCYFSSSLSYCDVFSPTSYAPFFNHCVKTALFLLRMYRVWVFMRCSNARTPYHFVGGGGVAVDWTLKVLLLVLAYSKVVYGSGGA